MRSVRGAAARSWFARLFVSLCLVLWAPANSAAQVGQTAPGGTTLPRPVPLYDLQADEALGGHTIARHVAKTDRDLTDRLRREPQISAASTYTDLNTARRVVAAAVAQSRSRIQAWASRTGPRPNLVVNHTEAGGRPIGRSLSRGARVSATCTRALVVLRWLNRERRWIVLTSYPEGR